MGKIKFAGYSQVDYINICKYIVHMWFLTCSNNIMASILMLTIHLTAVLVF